MKSDFSSKSRKIVKILVELLFVFHLMIEFSEKNKLSFSKTE